MKIFTIGFLSCLSALVQLSACSAAGKNSAPKGIWISREEIMLLPTVGPAWENVLKAASLNDGPPNLGGRNQKNDVYTLARALVFVRTGMKTMKNVVVDDCMRIIGTEDNGDALALGRSLPGYVIAADLVGLPPEKEKKFKAWLKTIVTKRVARGSLRSVHERRPNNWGMHAGAARIAVAAYLGDKTDLARAAQVFKGYLGDRDSYHGFKYGALEWQERPDKPVGINRKGAEKAGYSLDGVLPDDQRRAEGGFQWPPPKENYVYEALQGCLVQAVILHRAGFDVWNWEDKALLRAFRWLHDVAHFPAVGDDTWQPHLINHYYGTSFPAPVPSSPGKNVGWTEWTHGSLEPISR